MPRLKPISANGFELTNPMPPKSLGPTLDGIPVLSSLSDSSVNVPPSFDLTLYRFLFSPVSALLPVTCEKTITSFTLKFTSEFVVITRSSVESVSISTIEYS